MASILSDKDIALSAYYIVVSIDCNETAMVLAKGVALLSTCIYLCMYCYLLHGMMYIYIE